MKLLSVLLLSAAGLTASAAAQAADMPVKAKPIEYVKICSAYGAGFYYIPGTDICLRVGGRVRADYYHNGTGASPDIDSGNDRTEETHAFRGRGYVVLDARQNTAYGTLRAYMNIYQSFTTSNTGLGAREGTNGNRAFIQFAGFTFGRATSFFDFWSGYTNLDSYNNQTTDSSGWNVLAYTMQFSNGLSASLSMETARRQLVLNNAAPVFGAANVRAGQNVPAFVANLRTDQSWGSAQIMGALQELRVNDTVANPSSFDTYGWALGGGFTLKNPSAPGSEFGVQATWSEGAGGYASTLYGSHNILDGAPAGGVASTGLLADGVIVGATLHKTTVWAVHGGYQHRFNPQWAWSLTGGYTAVDYDAAVNALCGADCSYDFYSIGSRLNWNPVKALTIGFDVMYHEFGTQTGAAALAAAGVGALRSNDVWASMMRVQVDF